METIKTAEPIVVFSDIHANLEALVAVIDDFSKFKQEKNITSGRIYGLGGLVGYGPDPVKVLRILMGMESFGGLDGAVSGDHEKLVLDTFPLCIVGRPGLAST